MVFNRRAYTATTIDDIADELRATRGREYHYYGAKTDIFIDVAITGMDEMIASVQHIAAVSTAAINRLWAMAHEHAKLIAMPFSESRSRSARWTLSELATKQKSRTRSGRYEISTDACLPMLSTMANRKGVFRDPNGQLDTKPVVGALNWISTWYDIG
jgi:AcrR family transcriptional regulator